MNSAVSGHSLGTKQFLKRTTLRSHKTGGTELTRALLNAMDKGLPLGGADYRIDRARKLPHSVPVAAP